MNDHLGYSKYDWKNKKTSNSRGGHTKKTVKTQYGDTQINVPKALTQNNIYF